MMDETNVIRLKKIKRVLSPMSISVLFLFYENPSLITNMTGIFLKTNISYPSIRYAMKILLDEDICNKTNIGGGSSIICLNKESEIGKRIFELFDEILKRVDK